VKFKRYKFTNLRIREYLSLSAVVLVLFAVDRIIKLWFTKNPGYTRDFIVGFLSFHQEKNYGIAFGLPVNQIFILVLNFLIIAILVSILLRAYSRADLLAFFSLSLIIAGAFSNLFDRRQFGFVVDYIDVPFFTVFNLADIMISIGVGLIIVQELFFKKVKIKKIGSPSV